MIWIGTSGWVYPHWVGRFYPSELPQAAQLEFYARYFPTVEINRSYYRLPTRENFVAWTQQVARNPGFIFAVKASRYITHMKKLNDVDEALARLNHVAGGLGRHLGPVLYQLPPNWRANPGRLATFLSLLPQDQQAAFEFRHPSWFTSEVITLLDQAGCALVSGVGGSHPTPLDAPDTGGFRYIRFHHGAFGMGFTDAELQPWAERLASVASAGLTAYVYFNNDPGGHAINDALRLRQMLGERAVPPPLPQDAPAPA